MSSCVVTIEWAKILLITNEISWLRVVLTFQILNKLYIRVAYSRRPAPTKY